MNKRNLGRFCIQFNTNDDRHVQVIELLEAQGRRKAQYIAEAVLHYSGYREMPGIGSADLEKIVLAIVRKCLNKEKGAMTVSPERENHSEEGLVSDETAEPIENDDDLIASIRASMSELREPGQT